MKRLALFDLDHTLLPVDSDYEWGRFLGRLGLIDAEDFETPQALELIDRLGAQGLALEDFDEVWFYSDSANDLPLLEHATHPVATNPEPRLRAVARERSWPVIELFA